MSIDTVSDLPPRVQYVAAAAQEDFEYPFPVFENADLVAIVDGVTKALNTDYTVSGAGDDTGGTLSFVTPMTGGEIVTIYRDIAIARDTDFQQNGPFRAAAINDEFDKAFLIMQELESKIGRSLRLPITAEATDAQLELSPLSAWLDRYVTIDANGKPAPAVLTDQTLTSVAALQLVSAATGVLYVGDGSGRTGDLGAQINAAYAELPAKGGVIVVNTKSGGGKYDFSTPIVMTTMGKYALLQGMTVGGAISAEGCCLNYVPTTATAAITIDYASIVHGPPAPQHGLRDITLVNNDSNTSGGAGSLATAILVGNTNGGDWDATYERVHIQGFGIAYDNLNHNSVTQQWNSCVFLCNDICLYCGITTMRFMGCQFAANGTVVKQRPIADQPELYFLGTTVFDNFHDPVFDCNYHANPVHLDFTACHLENSPALHAHYITGQANVFMRGGIMEDDNPTGSEDFMIQTDNYTTVTIDDTLIVANRTLGAVVDATNLVRGSIKVVIRGSNVTEIVSGAHKAEFIVLVTNTYGTAYYPFNFPAAAAFRSALTLADPNFQGGSTYTVAGTDFCLSFSAACTVTLPDPATNTSRMLLLKNTAAAAVISASSNVIAMAGGGGGTAILAATAGKFALLQSNGTNWVTWMAN